MSILKKYKNSNEKARKQRYKHLKYICSKCGAYNHIDQGYCGMCMSTHLRKATEKEKQQTLSFIENVIDIHS
jgi:ribosomal protein L40E